MINKEHKDTLFAFLFGREENKRWTLELYNAVNGTTYTDPDEIEINTMSDVVYMGRKNDVSFIVSAVLNLYGHQSTFNPNVPLRGLMYVAKLYDKYVHQKKLNIYSEKVVEIPMPKLVVFYNGLRDEPDERILELKDAFPKDVDPAESDIQTRVRMLNINYGHNKELMDKCRPLVEYVGLIDRIRKNKAGGMGIEDAVDKALDEIPKDNLIRDFLIGNKAEVRDLCLTEYNEEETMEMFKQEYREEGRKEGREEGQDILASTICYLKSGKTPDELRRSGIDDATIQRALTCL